MQTLCEQMCEEVRPHIGGSGVTHARNIMRAIHDHIEGCSREQYIWIFMRAAALGMQVEGVRVSDEGVPSQETWVEFISSKLRIH
jgi:hypothetical protein